VKKILIVDDRPEVAELLQKTLGSGRFALLFAGTGQDALTVAREQRPDLIVMDVVMPGAPNGTEATRILKSDPDTKSSKVLILTGKSGPVVEEEAMRAGADAFLTKPFSPLELLWRIDELLGQGF
jgi:two-component system, OmpR family, phosphate regulon response regulator PhoB